MNTSTRTNNTAFKTIPNSNSPSTNSSTGQSSLLPVQTLRLKNADINLRYATLGNPQNPALILLHGVPENLHAWYAVAPILAEKFHVLAIDWPGFGGSDSLPSSEDYNSRNFARLIVDFMDTLGLKKAHLVATDIGLLPAFLVGLEHPHRVEKLAVMDGIPVPSPQHTSWELKGFARKGSIIGKALVSWFPSISAKIVYFKGFYRGHSIPLEVLNEFAKDGKNKSTQHAFLSYFQNFLASQEYFATRAHLLSKPVLVLWGSHDRFISKKLAFEIQNILPDAKLKIIDKAGHYVHMDKPKALTQAVVNFLT